MPIKNDKVLIGRFIKKGDLILSSLNIENFSFEGIGDFKPSYPDNPNGNIIHTYLHNPKKLKKTVKPCDNVEESFDPPNKRNIIMPRDFTDDWQRMRRRHKAKHGKVDEEEELELEMEYLSKKQNNNNNNNNKSEDQQIQDGSDAVTAEGDQERSQKRSPEGEKPPFNVLTTATTQHQDEEPPMGKNNQDIEDANASLMTDGISNLKIQKDTLDSMGKELHEFTDTEQEEKGLDQISKPSDYTPPPTSSPEKERMPSIPPSEEEAFIDLSALKNKEHQEQLENELNTAKELGYQEGFRIGEEKGIIQARGQLKDLSDRILELLSDLEGLKKNILHNSQQNFLTICQAMMESLLQHEFSINPKSFLTVIKRAIDEAVADDDFKIFVNPENLAPLKEVLDESFISKVKADETVPAYDFKIESNLTVVDGKISELIKDLLQQADLDLYKREEKAG